MIMYMRPHLYYGTSCLDQGTGSPGGPMGTQIQTGKYRTHIHTSKHCGFTWVRVWSTNGTV
ncbi:hypothetical protein BD310DRAFT_917977, partial [Dichomitus squalens]